MALKGKLAKFLGEIILLLNCSRIPKELEFFGIDVGNPDSLYKRKIKFELLTRLKKFKGFNETDVTLKKFWTRNPTPKM